MNEKYRTTVAFLLFCLLIFAAFMIVSKPEKKEVKKPLVVPTQKIKGKIAIVLDDWGYNLNNLPIVQQIRYPLTASVLPHLAYSRAVSANLHRSGFEIILHLPMEPHEKFNLEKNTILTSFTPQQIRDTMSEDLASIDYCAGISNHMGSKATEDARTMQAVLQEIKKRQLFFLDSLVSSKSVCAQLAVQDKVRFAKRDIFLDNQEDRAYIKGQLIKLRDKAREQGSAIGIGHDRKATLLVLKEMMPELESQGYRFVYLSDLVK
ncbi:MAG: divergent polysaccharide deacetylase family protein [Candidatus Omnitrophica bacterium]|nr:divergent polysaccharide deacetylase family protein [Candidatus Omnitrophota bacterium]